MNKREFLFDGTPDRTGDVLRYIERLGEHVEANGGKYRITVTRAHNPKSLIQCGYLFGLVLPTIAEHTGYTVDDLHVFFKDKFLPPSVREVFGKVVVDTASISGATPAREVAEYTDRIRAFASSELGLNIPDPDPDWKTRKAA